MILEEEQKFIDLMSLKKNDLAEDYLQDIYYIEK